MYQKIIYDKLKLYTLNYINKKKISNKYPENIAHLIDNRILVK